MTIFLICWMWTKRVKFKLINWLHPTGIGQKLGLSKEQSIFIANSKALMMEFSLMKTSMTSLNSYLLASARISLSINLLKLGFMLRNHHGQVPLIGLRDSSKLKNKTALKITISLPLTLERIKLKSCQKNPRRRVLLLIKSSIQRNRHRESLMSRLSLEGPKLKVIALCKFLLLNKSI